MGNRLRLSRHFSSLVLLGLALLSGIVFAQPPVTDGVRLIEDVESVYWDTPTPPPPHASWSTQSLPYNTREQSSITDPNAKNASYIWFRFNVDRKYSSDSFGLYFWRFNLAISVYFNGQEIGGSPSRENLTTMSWNHPLLISIQDANWRTDENEVMVRLTRSPWGGNFAPPLFGEMEDLTPLYNSRMFRQVEINEILFAFGLGLTLMSFILWAVRSRETVYLWFSGMCFFWSIIIAHMIVLLNPIPYANWLPIVHVAIDGAIFCMYCFIGRLIETVKRNQRERIFLCWALVAGISYFFIPAQYFFSIAYSFHLVGFASLAIIVFRVSKLAVRERNIPAIVVSLSLIVQISLFAHNYYLMFFTSTAEWEGNIFYAHFGIPLLFLVFIGTLLWRFQNALQLAEEMNKQLESKVEASRRVIEKSFAERRMLELNQAAEQERLNIYRELHDDVGSKLLSIVHADRNSNLGEMARSALESLRQAVSKANNPDQALLTFLQDIREEMELRLQGSGHNITWMQSIPNEECIVPSKIAFTLNRILKEVVSNIIRHAGADLVEVGIYIDAPQFEISVQDNGKGFDHHGPMGNGINNILSRAQEIGAVAEWHTEFCAGTRVHITLPFEVLVFASQAEYQSLQTE